MRQTTELLGESVCWGDSK